MSDYPPLAACVSCNPASLLVCTWPGELLPSESRDRGCAVLLRRAAAQAEVEAALKKLQEDADNAERQAQVSFT